MKEFILNINQRKISNIAKAKEIFNGLKDGKYLVQIKSINKRSLPQNNYYWGVVVPLVKRGLRDAGYNDVKCNDDAHEVLKGLFLKKKITSSCNAKEIVVAGSTADLQTKQFNEYLEDIWKWAAEYLDLQIPQPNEELVMLEEPLNERL